MASCELCGKHTVFGNKVKKIRTGLYSRTSKKIKPNLRHAKLTVNGRDKKVVACAHCLRSANRIRQ